jgi:hypothetical protein
MSEIRANSITDAAGTGAPNFPNGLESDGVAVATTADVSAVESVTLLGTLATTSGSSVTLSGLTLTSYKLLIFVLASVSTSATDARVRVNGNEFARVNFNNATDFGHAYVSVDLATGVFSTNASVFNSSAVLQAGSAYLGPSGITTSSTSIPFTLSTGTFDAGSIRIYGVK